MKKLTLIFILLLTHLAYAQVPQGIPYQAAARNASGQALVNTAVKVRFSILDSVATGTVVYEETHSTTTNTVGLFNVNVGMGTSLTGTFSSINWGKNAKFMQMELDITGTGSSYVDMGTQQMLSVPYALYAGNAKNSDNTLAVAGNTYTPQTRIGFDQSTTWTCPAGITEITVEVWGAGGGGGGGAGISWAGSFNYTGYLNSMPNNLISRAGGSGGNGGYNKVKVSVVPGQTYAVTIGGGGSPGAGGLTPSCYGCPSTGGNGSNGGNTVFGTNLVSASGGTGGTGTVNGNNYSNAGINGTSGAINNFNYPSVSTSTRTFIPTGYVTPFPLSFAQGGSGEPQYFYNNTSGGTLRPSWYGGGSAGESGYCVISY